VIARRFCESSATHDFSGRGRRGGGVEVGGIEEEGVVAEVGGDFGVGGGLPARSMAWAISCFGGGEEPVGEEATTRARAAMGGRRPRGGRRGRGVEAVEALVK